MLKTETEKFYKDLPRSPGVYLMRDASGQLLYVGKAADLQRRVASYFLRPQDARLERLVSRIARVDHQKTDTAIEALILEAELIKKNDPPFNIREKDDKSFLYVKITDEKYPRVVLVRGKDLAEDGAKVYGPFTSAASVRQALRVVRRIFPYSIHPPKDIGRLEKSCFDAQIGLCPGVCLDPSARRPGVMAAGGASLREYRKNIRNIALFFEGRKERIIKNLEREMNAASKKLDFEKAEEMRRRIFSLRHIRDIAFISEDRIGDPGRRSGKDKSFRIEGYDISNISGTSAVGVMVVFADGEPDKQQYRKFRIRSVPGADDTAMLAEVLRRRLRNDWPPADLILVDGGLAQVNAARKTLKEHAAGGVKIPVIGMAKGPERKRTDVIGTVPPGIELKTLVRVRDEAHRFAIAYHRKVRGRGLYE